MNKMTYVASITLMHMLGGSHALAEIGVTDACQDEAVELQDKIDNNKDDYTAESRRKAKNQLLAAKTNRLNPAKCRGNIVDARRELREGKRDRKKKDKD